MTKHFCDICQKELEFENRIDVSGWHTIQDSSYCFDCFHNTKKWKIIISRAAKRPESRNPIALKLKRAKIPLV